MLKSGTVLSGEVPRNMKYSGEYKADATLPPGKYVLEFRYDYTALSLQSTLGLVCNLWESAEVDKFIENEVKLFWARNFNKVMIDWNKRLDEHGNALIHKSEIVYKNAVIQGESGRELNIPYPECARFYVEFLENPGWVLIMIVAGFLAACAGLLPSPSETITNKIIGKNWPDKPVGIGLPSFSTVLLLTGLAFAVFLFGKGLVNFKGALS